MKETARGGIALRSTATVQLRWPVAVDLYRRSTSLHGRCEATTCETFACKHLIRKRPAAEQTFNRNACTLGEASADLCMQRTLGFACEATRASARRHPTSLYCRGRAASVCYRHSGLRSLISARAGRRTLDQCFGVGARGGPFRKQVRRLEGPVNLRMAREVKHSAGLAGMAPDAPAESYRLGPLEYLRRSVIEVLSKEYGDALPEVVDPMVVFSSRPEFGDFQCNVAMSLARQLKSKPRDVAERLRVGLEQKVAGMCATPLEVAGPGFVNFRLSDGYLASVIRQMMSDPRGKLNVPEPPKLQRIVVDFSSPNIAKEMHVGHLRSTIIGDTLCRVLEYLGHTVIRLNHVGDWGTQFGMLIAYLAEVAPEALTGERPPDLGDLVAFYKQAKKRFDEDPVFQNAARAQVTKLQSGDEASLRAWRLLCELSRREFEKIYQLLDVQLTERGESFYNPYLPDVIEHLERKGLVQVDQGALCVFLEGFKNRDGSPQPLIVRKSDGGYMYSTTDLAAILYRVQEDRAQRILYVTDAGQATHFAQVFQVARRAGFFDPAEVSLEHVPFGLVLGDDGKKFKTRSGDTVRLMDLLERAIELARHDLEQRIAEQPGRTESPEYLERAARAIGIGAVKYADLRTTRTADYRFSYEKMLSLNGNTAPYMMYVFTRVSGIARKAAGLPADAEVCMQELVANCASEQQLLLCVTEPAEGALARQLLRFPYVLLDLERELMPHVLCEYLFELSQRFNQFYEHCPVLGAEDDSVRHSRLALCALTGYVVESGLRLLGIEVLPRL